MNTDNYPTASQLRHAKYSESSDRVDQSDELNDYTTDYVRYTPRSRSTNLNTAITYAIGFM